MDNKQRRCKPIPTAIRHHLLKQQQSKHTIKEYCQKNGITAQTFYSWRKRYGKRLFVDGNANIVASEGKVTFASLGILNTMQRNAALFDIRFPAGITVSVYHGTSAEDLAPFLTLISGDSTC
jgi:hypothetical protein